MTNPIKFLISGLFGTLKVSNAPVEDTDVVRKLDINGILSDEVQIGANADATGLLSVAIGERARVTKGSGIAIGQFASARADAAIALGAASVNQGTDPVGGVAVGAMAKTNSSYDIAIGFLANSEHDGAVAIGRGSETYAPYEVSLGSTMHPQDLRIHGKGRMINETVAGDAANVLTTKGYVDTAIDTAVDDITAVNGMTIDGTDPNGTIVFQNPSPTAKLTAGFVRSPGVDKYVILRLPDTAQEYIDIDLKGGTMMTEHYNLSDADPLPNGITARGTSVRAARQDHMHEMPSATDVGAEPVFTKNTAFNKDFGTTSETVCRGNDARLSDARTPTAHSHTMDDIDSALDISTKTSNHTLALADAGTMIKLSHATAIALTIPTNATVAFPIGTQILLTQAGAGQATISPASGVTVNSAESATLTRVQHSVAGLIKTGTDEWLLFGDVAVSA